MGEERAPTKTLFREVIQLCGRVAEYGDQWFVELGREARDAAYYVAEELGVLKAISRVAGGIADAAAEVTTDWKRQRGERTGKKTE